MRPPAFWLDERPSAVARLLSPLGQLYGAVTAQRMRRAGWRAAVPVICIGNFTLGGAGKTPTAIAVAEVLEVLGHSPGFLSRGYGGTAAGPLRVDPLRHSAKDVGDEPLLLARRALTIVSRDRLKGSALATREGADVIVMDDGLQNPALHKDLTLAVVDGATGIGNALPFPAGPLRAPLEAQWPHVDALVVIGDGAPGDRLAVDAEQQGRHVIRGVLQPEAETALRLCGRRVLAFAGIGRPEKFFASLDRIGCEVVERHLFPDHHRYREEEIAGLLTRAEAQKLVPVTTEKDAVRLRIRPAMLEVLPVTLVAEGLDACLRKALSGAGPA